MGFSGSEKVVPTVAMYLFGPFIVKLWKAHQGFGKPRVRMTVVSVQTIELLVLPPSAGLI